MPNFFRFVLECFEDLTLIVGYIQNPSQGWIEGLDILVTVTIVVGVQSLTNYTKEKKFQKLNEESQVRYINIIRDRKEIHASVFDLVVGDIVKMSTGDKVPGK